MRLFPAVMFAACVLLTTQTASAGPFGRTRSDTSDEVGTTTIKRPSKRPKAKTAPKKAAKPEAKSPKRATDDEEIIIIEEPVAKAKPAKPAKKIKPAKPKAEDDEEIVIVNDDEPVKKAVRASIDDEDPTPTRSTVAMTEDAADEDAPMQVSKAAPAKPRKTRFYFRAGGFKQSSKLGATEFALQTDLPIETNLGADSGVEMEQSQIPVGVIIGYVLPVLDRKLSLETVLGFPTKSKFKATGALANESLAPTFMGMATGIEPLGPDIGEATFAPPMVTAVYRIREFGRVTPIAGAGVMLLLARGAKITNPVLVEAGDPKLSFTPSPGLVLQTGAEVRITPRIAARLDIKYVVGMRVNAKIEDIAVTPKAIPGIGSIEVGDAVMSAKVTPLVVTAGVGADF